MTEGFLKLNPKTAFFSKLFLSSVTAINNYSNREWLILPQVTNVSRSTQYSLNVFVPEVPPFNHNIPLVVYINMATSTITPPAQRADSDVITVLIIVVVVQGVMLVTALIAIFILYWRLGQKQSLASSSSTKQQGNFVVSFKKVPIMFKHVLF